MYQNQVDIVDLNQLWKLDCPDHAETKKTCCQLLFTHVLADKLGDMITANVIIDEMITYSDITKSLPTIDMTRQACEITLEDSPIQRLLLDYCVHEATPEYVEGLFANESVPRQFLGRMSVQISRLHEENRNATIRKIFKGDYVEKRKCQYHQHDKEHPHCGDGCK